MPSLPGFAQVPTWAPSRAGKRRLAARRPRPPFAGPHERDRTLIGGPSAHHTEAATEAPITDAFGAALASPAADFGTARHSGTTGIEKTAQIPPQVNTVSNQSKLWLRVGLAPILFRRNDLRHSLEAPTPGGVRLTCLFPLIAYLR